MSEQRPGRIANIIGVAVVAFGTISAIVIVVSGATHVADDVRSAVNGVRAFDAPVVQAQASATPTPTTTVRAAFRRRIVLTESAFLDEYVTQDGVHCYYRGGQSSSAPIPCAYEPAR